MKKDPARSDMLILVDGLDNEAGTATKEEAHVKGLLHRAFSVVLKREGAGGTELLLAQRAKGKYHSSGLWANSCCSHPRAGEEVLSAGIRRVNEELGCEVQNLHELSSFIYRAVFDDGLIEYEYDHILLGDIVGTPSPDPSEIGGFKWVTKAELSEMLRNEPESFCAWAYTVFSETLKAL